MLLQILSDLHLEHYPDHGDQLAETFDFNGADLVVLAGDIAGIGVSAYIAMQRIQSLCSRASGPVLYLPGNHEYYRADPSFVETMLGKLEAQTDNLTILRTGQIFEYGGLRILGDTLWFPNEPDNWRFAPLMSDFQVIRQFTPWVYERNAAFVEWLEHELRPGDVVITHHLPSPMVVAPQYQGNALNRFFVSDLTNLILERAPALWVCGHTHTSIDMQIGEARVVCNPRGYPNERQTTVFDPRLVVEVGRP